MTLLLSSIKLGEWKQSQHKRSQVLIVSIRDSCKISLKQYMSLKRPWWWKRMFGGTSYKPQLIVTGGMVALLHLYRSWCTFLSCWSAYPSVCKQWDTPDGQHDLLCHDDVGAAAGKSCKAKWSLLWSPTAWGLLFAWPEVLRSDTRLFFYYMIHLRDFNM